MSKAIRVIDLLNKIANGEDVPEKIKFEHSIYTYFKEQEDYINYADEDNKWYGQTLLFAIMLNHKINEILDAKVEIIEEQEEIDIQSIEELDENFTYIENHSSGLGIEKVLNKAEIELVNKINKLVQAVKQLDKKIKEK